MRLVLWFGSFLLLVTAAAPAQEQVVVDAHAASTPFPHFWEEMFGSGRAILTLRESYRDDLRAVKQVTDFKYVRFHAILHDELGVYNEDEHGNPVYNFAYVDQIYDGLLKNGIRPFVEISFMPKKLASRPEDLHAFWYKQNVSPPKDYAKWDALITALTQHLVERYGIEKGLQQGLQQAIADVLEAKFGKAGKRLMKKIRAIDDANELRALFKAVLKAETLGEIRDRL